MVLRRDPQGTFWVVGWFFCFGEGVGFNDSSVVPNPGFRNHEFFGTLRGCARRRVGRGWGAKAP